MQVIGTFGRVVGMNPDDVKMEDATRLVVNGDTNLCGGIPLTIVSPIDSGVSTFQLVGYKYLVDNALSYNVPFYGLSKFSKNTYLDETYDKLGTFGGGRGTAMLLGRISLMNNVYRQEDGSTVSVYSFDTTKTYTAMQKLYVECNVANAHLGKITNALDEAGDGINTNTFIGWCVNWFPSATQPVLEVLLRN